MLLLSLLLVAGGLGLAAAGLVRQRQVAVEAAEPLAAGLTDDVPAFGLVYRTLEPLFNAGGRLMRRLSPTRRLDLARDRIVYAGLEGTLTVERLLSYKAGAALAGLAVGLLGGPLPTLLWAPVLAVGASFVPDVLLSSRADRRQRDIARALPEALDLLALTVQAGLGFEQALEVVVENTGGPLGGELQRLLREVELGVSRREALGSLRDRTEVPELSSFVVAIVQSDQMGIALGDVLKTQASQVRLRRRQRAKEQAAKTPVKILFPVVIGVFPALFVVTVGPGAIQIAKTLL